MENIIILIVVLVVAFLVFRALVLWYWKINRIESLLEKIERNTRGVPAEDAKSRESDRRDRVMTLIKEKGEITNDDVEKMLGVSDATATRYLDKLEKEGKIIQIGREGRFVKYRLK